MESKEVKQTYYKCNVCEGSGESSKLLNKPIGFQSQVSTNWLHVNQSIKVCPVCLSGDIKENRLTP